MLNRKSPVPLYHQLAEILLAAIRTSTYAEGERIPSEHALAQQYSIGRPTVRQAIDSLVRKGVLIRKRGSGTFVAHKRESVDLFSLAGTMASFTKTGLSPEVELLQRPSRIVLDGDDVNPFSRSAALFLSRLSRVDATPVLVEDIYMDPAVFAAIETMDLTGQSLSRIVRDRFLLNPSGGEQRFRITYPDKRLAELLELARSIPILEVNRFLHFPDAENAIYAAMYCRTDRFVFTQNLGGISHG